MTVFQREWVRQNILFNFTCFFILPLLAARIEELRKYSLKLVSGSVDWGRPTGLSLARPRGRGAAKQVWP